MVFPQPLQYIQHPPPLIYGVIPVKGNARQPPTRQRMTQGMHEMRDKPVQPADTVIPVCRMEAVHPDEQCMPPGNGLNARDTDIRKPRIRHITL